MSNQSDPATRAWLVTPHDTNPISPRIPRAIRVGVGGTLVGQLVGNSEDVTFQNVADGEELAYRFKFIKTATTCSNIIALD